MAAQGVPSHHVDDAHDRLPDLRLWLDPTELSGLEADLEARAATVRAVTDAIAADNVSHEAVRAASVEVASGCVISTYQ